MSLWSDLLSEALRHAKGDALIALQNLEVAAMTGHASGMSGTLLAYAERIMQAEEKAAAGANVARMSELLTMAQFGAGSIGGAIAAIYESPDTVPRLEALFVSRFLVEIVLQRESYPGLYPDDLLRRHDLERHQLCDPAARPALNEIVERARETADRASVSGTGVVGRELASLIFFERKLLSKRLSRLTSDPCSTGPIDLGLWDRLSGAISLRLRNRASP